MTKGASIRAIKIAKGKIREDIVKAIFKTHAYIVENAPVDTGRFRQSIKVEETLNGWVIGSNVHYAEYLETGTKPHEIRPKEKKALRFVVDGKEVFAKKVNHPGTDGYRLFHKGVLFFEKEMNKCV